MELIEMLRNLPSNKFFVIVCPYSGYRREIHQYLEANSIHYKTSMESPLFEREFKLCTQQEICFKCKSTVTEFIRPDIITGTCKECGYRFGFKNDWGNDYTYHSLHGYNQTVKPVAWNNNMIVIGRYLNANRSKPNHAMSNNSITAEEIAEIMKDLKTFEIEIDSSFCSSNKKLSDKKIQEYINAELTKLILQVK